WRSWPERAIGRANTRAGVKEALQVFQNLLNESSVAAEATIRLGALKLRTGATAQALDLFTVGESRTRDPFLLYLARFLRGQALERTKQSASAEVAYRDALQAVPGAQSASLSLAALLFARNSRAEAARLLDVNLSGRPQPVDPWRAYADADDRFWPQL